MTLGYAVRALTATVAILGLLYLVVVNGLSGAATQSPQPAAALAFRSGAAEAAAKAGEQALAGRDTARAIMLAQQAVEHAPIDARAVRVLGMALTRAGREDQGGKLMLKAGALGWRDTPTQVWLITQATYQMDLPTLVERVDGLLRRQVKTDDMLRLFHFLARDQRVRREIIARLVEDPPWGERFFTRANLLRPVEFAAHGQLLREFKREGGRVDRVRLAPFTARLVSAGKFREARQIWAELREGPRPPRSSYVIDPEFVADMGGSSAEPAYPFEWRLRDEEGGYAVIGTPPMLSGETSLQAESNGGPAITIAEQTITLPAGRRTLNYDIISDTHAAGEAFEWSLTCLRGGSRVDGRPGPVRKIGAWSRMTIDFTVPGQACGAQKLELRTRQRAGRETMQAWFDRVTFQGGSSRTDAPAV